MSDETKALFGGAALGAILVFILMGACYAIPLNDRACAAELALARTGQDTVSVVTADNYCADALGRTTEARRGQ